MPLAGIEFQTILTAIVAIAGFITTFLAAYLTNKQEARAERERWLRDRRAEVYPALMAAYFQAITMASDAKTS
jgi:hypothetical protein